MLEETYDNCRPSHPTAMINIHGTLDGVIPYNGGSTGYKSINEVMTYWVNFNDTNTSPTTDNIDDNGITIEHYLYPDGDGGTSVEHYKVVGGEHVWFDNNFNGSSTSRLIWDFVSKYDNNGLR